MSVRKEDRNASYVYILFRPDGRPCYVGKGIGYRWLEHERDAYNPHLARIIAKAGGTIPKVKIREGLTDAEARETEIAFIAAIGRVAHGGPLVNMTDGGDGAAGYKHTPEARKKISESLKTRPVSDTTREKMRQNALRQTPTKHSEETKARIAEANRGRIMPPEQREKLSLAKLGHAVSEETRQKIREKLIGSKLSDETKAKLSALSKSNPKVIATLAKINEQSRGIPLGEEHRAKISAALMGHSFSDESRAKMSASRLGVKRGPMSPEALSARRAKRANYVVSEETRAKISAAAKAQHAARRAKSDSPQL
jgi:hypothetical protein